VPFSSAVPTKSMLNLEDTSEAKIQEVKETFDQVIATSIKGH